jgi:hypothetical protein
LLKFSLLLLFIGSSFGSGFAAGGSCKVGSLFAGVSLAGISGGLTSAGVGCGHKAQPLNSNELKKTITKKAYLI